MIPVCERETDSKQGLKGGGAVNDGITQSGRDPSATYDRYYEGNLKAKCENRKKGMNIQGISSGAPT